MSSICGECGKRLASSTMKHSLQDCAKHHLKRALEILPQINLEGIQKARLDATYALKVLTLLESLVKGA